MQAPDAPELAVMFVVLGVVCALPLAGAIALVVMVIWDRMGGRSDGERRADNRALLARTAAQAGEPTPGPSPPRWRTWAPWLLLALILLLAVAVGQTAWVR